MATDLLGVRHPGECYDVLDRWLPRAVHLDDYGYLLADVRTGSCLRRPRARATPEASVRFAAEDAWGEVLLELARSTPPGSCLTLAELKDCPEGPAGWDRKVGRLADACGFFDSIAVFLFFSRHRERGLALILWHAGPGSAFTEDDVAAVRTIGPLLAAAFTKSIEHGYERLNGEIPAQVLAGADQFAFVVSRDGVPLECSDQARTRLASAFGGPRNGARVPQALRTLVVELIRSLEMNPVPGVSSADFKKKNRRCRVYLSRVDPTPDGAPAFKVLVDCNPETFSLSLLSDAGLSEFQIKIVELLQRGAQSATIAEAFKVSLGDVNYHLKEIGEKIYADGKTEIVARALTLYHEIAIRRGFTGPRDERKDAFGPRRAPADVPWWSVPPPGTVPPQADRSRPAAGRLNPAPAFPARRPEVSV
ncbi:MAG: helix-turn-helix transcriptional regulator [Deltaproteobacteria bacterium]|nr:helix-turn-helix transcriptional regulator [Deltaproteobacteria bacterium]